MDTRWKNRLTFLALILLFVFGSKGVLSGLTNGGDYLKRDYFQTQQFQSQSDEFMGYLSAFEFNYLSSEEMKKEITVSADEINEHRYRYGDLGQQVQDIQNQYEQKIHEADLLKNKELAEAYIKERDTKIEDIKNNFLTDDYVRTKVIKEKEQTIDDFHKDLERSRAQFENLKTEFSYYLRDTTSGKVYTNLTLPSDTDLSQVMNDQTMITIKTNPLINNDHRPMMYRSHSFPYNNTVEQILSAKEHRFEGHVGVPKASPSTSTVLINYQEYQTEKNVFLLYTLVAILALILSITLFRRTTLMDHLPWEKIRTLYHRIPLDVRGLGMVFSTFLTLILLTQHPHFYLLNTPYQFFEETLFDVMVTSAFVVLTAIQGKFWFERVQAKDWASFKAEWRQSLLQKAYDSIQTVFLNRSMGTQTLLLLAVVFVFGAGAVAVILEPEVLVVYIPAFILIGIPTLRIILKRTGYFNRIVMHTTDLTQGNTQVPDLPIKGKSSLATLAANVNQLKSGVKSSQKEQAKSERLKTELITNVSHDLRTPLTSIITYTELLKTPELTEEDREAYVQIIDRKAKRLKVLIDDLFEVSKMVSGSVELVKEKVDLVQLLQQALGEHNEAIHESTLTFRVTTPEKPLYATVDGQKLWRVFDNLIGNILKYSLENTRVYLSVKPLEEKVEIVFKNVTKYELGENVNELYERFKRGDTSRHTDGSGLGLAIAKSIVDLHEGDLTIEIDGDLFKVTILLDSAR